MTRPLRTALAAAAAAALLAAGPAPAAGKPVVLFDEGHGQPFRVAGGGDLDLSGLAGLLRQAGAEVGTTAGGLDDGALAGAAALVISGAFAPLAPAEVGALRRFLDRGGRLVVMLHIAPPLQSLLEALGIQYSRAPLREADGVIGPRDTDFQVTRFDPHPLTAGLGRIAVFGCYGVRSAVPQARIIAGTGPRAWPDTDGNGRPSGGEPVGVHGVAVAGTRGRGEFAVFGDDAIFQNRFLASHNREAGERLARWLAGAATPPPPPPPPPSGATTPL